MRSFLLAVSVSVALWLALQASGDSLGLPEIVAIAFSAGLVGWVAESYRYAPRQLVAEHPIHLPASGRSPKHDVKRVRRKAA